MRAESRHLQRLLAAFAVLASLLPGPAGAGEDLSAAERSVFVVEHLAGIDSSTDLNYEFSHLESSRPDVVDTVTVSIRPDPARGRVVNAEFLHGERALRLPEVEHATANPVVLYFLEHDVRDMRRRLGGMENYFRKRIRLALANEARSQDVQFEYGGASRKGTRIEIVPYQDDPNRARFNGMERKRYHFLISDQVPGGVFEIGTVVDADPARKLPEVREVLRLSARGQ